MDYSSLIKAFQDTLDAWEFDKPLTSSEGFAQKRFLKKFERPVDGKEAILSQKAWDDYSAFDQSLPKNLTLPSGQWYRARHLIHRWCASFTLLNEVRFPRGSSVAPSKGRNSIAQYLEVHDWTVTPGAFDAFAKMVYGHNGLKKAARKRIRQFLKASDEHPRDFDARCCSSLERDDGCAIFAEKLWAVCSVVQGSRFSSVYKNNEKRRPINLEPFGNLLLQGRIGESIRSLLRRVANLDLDHTQDVHRVRIANLHVATLDLTNASDSVSWALVRFLFPPWFVRLLEEAHSPMILGPDDQYHILNRVSSMGNGFTFELMTMILLALCRTLDPSSSVFGDDIIICRDASFACIDLLAEVGFVINKEKSFVGGLFRESCGANWFWDEGYVKSYDFRWPTSIHDCIVIFNKVASLDCYPSFKRLKTVLARHIPLALRGGVEILAPTEHTFKPNDNLDVSGCFWSAEEGVKGIRDFDHLKRAVARKYCVPAKDLTFHWGFSWEPRLARPTRRDLRSTDIGTYMMYLRAGRVCGDTVSREGRWVRVLYLCVSGVSRRFSPQELND